MDSQLEALLAEYIEQRDQCESLTPEQFLEQQPQLTAAQRDAFSRATEGFCEVEALFPRALALPRKLGGYRVQETLGRGATGVVVRAVDTDQRSVAIKLLNLGSLLSPRVRERFRREAESLQQVDHRHVVKVHAAGVEDGQPFLVMDYVEGVTLSEYLQRCAEDARELQLPGSGTPRQRILRCVSKLAAAVSEIHARGILHRDLKPQNIVIDRSGEPVLVDFGLAVREDFDTLTTTGDVMGTLAYMAPEQARGERATHAVDVYGLGAVLYELLTLHPPIREASTVATLRRASEVGMVRRLPAELEPELRAVLYRCLAFHPHRRYSSAVKLACDLEALLRGERIEAKAPTLQERFADAVRCRRNLRRRVAMVVVLLVGGIATASWMQHTRWVASESATCLRSAAITLIDGDLSALESHSERLRKLQPNSPWVPFFEIQSHSSHELAADSAAASRMGSRGGRATDGIDTVDISRSTLDGPRQKLQELMHLMQKKEYGEAWPQARQLCSDSESIEEPLLTGLARVAHARIARRLREDEIAAREYSAARALFPESAALCHELAELYYRLDQNELALEPALTSVRLVPQRFESWLLLARLQLKLDQVDDGFVSVQRAVDLARTQAEKRKSLRTLAACHDMRGEPERSIQAFQRAYAIDSTNVSTVFSLGLVSDRLRRAGDAERYYREALQLDAKHCPALLNLAYLYATQSELCDWQQSQELVERALQVDGGKTAAVVQTAIVTMEAMGLLPQLQQTLEKMRDAATADGAIVQIQHGLQKIRRKLEESP